MAIGKNSQKIALLLIGIVLIGTLIILSVSTGFSQHNINLTINEKAIAGLKVLDGSAYIKLEDAQPYAKVPIKESLIKTIDNQKYVHARNFFTQIGYAIAWNNETRTVLVYKEIKALPTLTEAKLQEIIKNQHKQPFFPGIFRNDLMGIDDAERSMSMDKAASPDGAAAGTEFSGTNIQVAGVDEADIVKTDGKYLYQLTNDAELIISQIFPKDKMQVITTKSFQKDNFNPSNIYIHADQIIVIGSYMEQSPIPPRPPILRDSEFEAQASSLEPELSSKMPPFWGKEFTKAYILKFENQKIETVREIEIEGHYVASRKIDSHIYLVSNMYFYDVVVPYLKDSLISDIPEAISFDQICYFPGYPNQTYLNVLSFDINDRNKKAEVATYLGAGSEIYMSRETLYITMSGYPDTEIYKFDISGTDINYAAKGKVNGSLLNQFSMDEHNGFFRIATTSQDHRVMSNNIFVLNRNLDIVSKITGIAPTERIYSVRFMGDKMYMVTFEIIDPFFVIDLSDPFKPEILGELKIPGFSSYLHPIDENHILGIGKDVTLEEQRDSLGNIIGNPFGIEKGLKISVFDVSDLSNPIEKHQVILGTEGTYSEALQDHKAVLFDYRNNLLVLPVHLSYNYKFNDQGAYVYRIDLDKGFALIGNETHTTLQSRDSYDYQQIIKRSIYINETLYFISDAKVSARNINSFSESQTLELKR